MYKNLGQAQETGGFERGCRAHFRNGRRSRQSSWWIQFPCLSRCTPPISPTRSAPRHPPPAVSPSLSSLKSQWLCHSHGRPISEILLLHFYMSATVPTRLRYRRTPSSDRFLDVFSHPLPRSSLPGPTNPEAGDELHEDEIFWIGGFDDPPNTAPARNPLSRRCGAQGTSGILAALPESERSPGAYGRPMFNQKASSSRMIPAIPKPTVERHVPVSAKYHQSAPVNVPVLSKAVRRAHEFNADDIDDGAEGEMLPPHEIVARGSEHSPGLSCSVLEGVGRTLKGRDLRQVRNAVWRQTGFLDWRFQFRCWLTGIVFLVISFVCNSLSMCV